MGRNKFEEPKYPPVDLLKAVILERKMEMKLTHEDLARCANVHPDYMRKMMTKIRTEDWSPDIRNAVCRLLRINIQTTLSLVTDDGAGIRMN